MTAAKRDLSKITVEELEVVKHLTFRDAVVALGVGSPNTVKNLYIEHGIDYVKRKAGVIADYHTRKSYTKKAKKAKLFGKNQDWDRLDRKTATDIGLPYSCPDIGSEMCPKCELGLFVCIETCDNQCHKCKFEQECPCSKYSWEKRQNE